MYGKLFAQMYDGTLASVGPWQALVTFQQLIILANKRGEVDMTIDAICRKTTIPVEVIRPGIEALMAEDPDSRTPDEGGRRIVLISDSRSWGWRIVNYKYYRNLRNEDERQEYHRQYYHVRKNSTVSTNSTETQQTQPSARKQNAVSSKQNADQKQNTVAEAPFRELEMVKAMYPKRSGTQSWPKAAKALRARLSDGVAIETILDGVSRYANWCKATGKVGTEVVMQAVRFLGPDEHYLNPYDPPLTKGEVKQNKNIDATMDFLAQLDEEKDNGSR